MKKPREQDTKFRWNNLPGEDWRDVVTRPGFYWVSNLGRVRSRYGVMQSTAPSHRYRTVTLRRPKQSMMVHRLVLEAFCGRPPEGHEGAHIDGCPANNRLDNLQWVTSKENARHRDQHGRTSRGVDRPAAKLCDEVVRHIRNSLVPQRALAKQLGVAFSLIGMVRRREIWRHVQ